MKRLFILAAAAAALSLAACGKFEPQGMAAIPGGTFAMGSPETDPDYVAWEGPQHDVTLSPFYLGVCTVNQADYESLMGVNPSHSQDGAYPMETISWYNAVEYCNALSKKERRKPAYAISGTNVKWNRKANGYRLPTEAEWEYACRAGTATRYNTGDDITAQDARFYAGEPIPAGNYPPNEWGLFDMHGNLYEWCWDWYGDYGAEPQVNPSGAESGERRIIRGGSAASDAQHLRSAERGRAAPDVRNVNLGFRVAMNAK